MKKLSSIFFLLALLTVDSLFQPSSWATIALTNGKWSTTFDCPEWTQGQTLNCNGLTQYGNWTCNGTGDEITSSANNPIGAGGKGYRFWKGDGTDVDGGALQATFASAQPELWVRWYMRYQAGFKWSSLNYDKWIYFYTGGSSQAIAEFVWSDSIRIYSQGPGISYQCNNCGWATVFGTASDGSWHCYEVHMKMDTNGSNGIAELWVDGVKKFSYTNSNWGTNAGWTNFHFGSNQDTTNNGRCAAVDFDDIVVSTTGYIGPISFSNAPSAPYITSLQ